MIDSPSTDSAATTEPINPTTIAPEQVAPEQVALIDLARDTILLEIKDQLLQEFKDQTFDKSLLMKLIIRGMEIVETTDFKGSDQKNLVIDILIKLLETDGLDAPHKDELIVFLKDDATNVIDVIVDASRGNININKVEPIVIRLVTCLFSCLKKNQQNKV
jgi:hypothetical protein